MNASIVRYCGINTSERCGYCVSTKRSNTKLGGTTGVAEAGEEKQKDGSISFGVIAHLLSVENFNQILDIGWSRSGCYLYKPVMERTCCPQYTIRLDVHEFKLSRSQKRVLNAMLHFLRDDVKPSGKEWNERSQSAGAKPLSLSPLKVSSTTKGQRENLPQLGTGILSRTDELQPALAAGRLNKPCEKKKILRRRLAEDRLKSKGIDLEQHRAERAAKEKARRRTLESFLSEGAADGWKHKLETRLISVHTEEFAATFDESLYLYKRYQQSIHEDDEEDLTRKSYTRFLVSSPLFVPSDAVDSKSPALGSYHQQYRLDGKLIAVAVLDVLPRCLSSKYFYYDPEYRFLSLGTYSALREIAYTRRLAIDRPELHYYYMGFYLYDCPKMRYKGKFRPSDLLCDQTHQWVPLTECLKLLDESKGKFTPFAGKALLGQETDAPLDNLRCLVGNKVVPFPILRGLAHNPESLEERARTYVRYAGLVANEMIVCLS